MSIIPVLGAGERVPLLHPAWLGHDAYHVKDCIFPLSSPCWISFGEHCCGVDVVAVVEVVVVVHPVPEVGVVVVQAIGAADPTPHLLVHQLVPVCPTEPALDEGFHSVSCLLGQCCFTELISYDCQPG